MNCLAAILKTSGAQSATPGIIVPVLDPAYCPTSQTTHARARGCLRSLNPLANAFRISSEVCLGTTLETSETTALVELS